MEGIQIQEKKMTIEELVKHVRRKGKNGLLEEFLAIEEEPVNATYIEADKDENYYRNRYYNVLCMDQTRVKLASGIYINANFADGYQQKNAYIAAQGPLPETFIDFWEMVWEQSVLTVAMATRLTDGGRYSLCGEYWPQKNGTSIQFGKIDVTNIAKEKQSDCVVTSLLLKHTKTGEVRTITHLQFTSWPDYGVPNSATAFLDFLFRVRQCQEKAVASVSSECPVEPPIVVHCSAGIGRTGTFCTVDICLRSLADTGTLDVSETLKKLRSQRPLSIQTHEQYLFTYKALLEHAQCEDLIKEDRLKAFVKRFCKNG